MTNTVDETVTTGCVVTVVNSTEDVEEDSQVYTQSEEISAENVDCKRGTQFPSPASTTPAEKTHTGTLAERTYSDITKKQILTNRWKMEESERQEGFTLQEILPQGDHPHPGINQAEMGTGFCNLKTIGCLTGQHLVPLPLKEQRELHSYRLGREEEVMSSNRPELVAL